MIKKIFQLFGKEIYYNGYRWGKGIKWAKKIEDMTNRKKDRIRDRYVFR